jgi:polyhydroxybutyrate depolymerase
VLAFSVLSLLLLVIFQIIFYYKDSPFGIKTNQRKDGVFFDNYDPVGEKKKLSLVEKPKTLTGQIQNKTIVVAGYERKFLYYLPEKMGKTPKVIFVLHGSWDNGKIIRAFTGYEFDQIADQEGFIVAYPDGYCGGWNEIRIKSPLKANKRDVDDLRFFESMITYFKEQYNANPDSNLIFGFSNGGQMAFRLALEIPERISAIATVGASLPIPGNSKFPYKNLPKSISVMLIHGTDDKVVPFHGGEVSIMKIIRYGKVYSAEITADFWRRAAGHDQAPEIHIIGDVEVRTWISPHLPLIKSLYVHGGGHTIPNQKYTFPNQADLTNQDISTVQIAWEFFSEIINQNSV